jgi:hypothetical protein
MSITNVSDAAFNTMVSMGQTIDRISRVSDETIAELLKIDPERFWMRLGDIESAAVELRERAEKIRLQEGS